jgi:hypothetical protein
LVTIVLVGLLRTVANGTPARGFDCLDVGSVNLDFRDEGTGVRLGQKSQIEAEEGESRLIVALAEEIGFADGLVGERNVKGRDRTNGETKRDEKREVDAREMRHGENLE